ncbi:MAG: NfeD family protein [Treponemataceae bacterium]|nr:NfeD family protein [Treponemataceae bacterium]
MMDLIMNNLPWFWLGMVIVFTVIEIFTAGLTTIWFAIGSIPMIFLSFLPIPFLYQVLIMLVISIVLLIFTRPFFVKKLNANKEKTNVDALIGKTALVTKKITKFEKGEVKIDGKIWTAKSVSEEDLEEGTECLLQRIEGVTAIVSKK